MEVPLLSSSSMSMVLTLIGGGSLFVLRFSSFNSLTVAYPLPYRVFSAPACSTSGSKSASWIVTWLEETFSSSLTLPFEFELNSQLVMTKVRLLTLTEPSVFTSKVETCLMHEGTKLQTSLVSPMRLNTKLLACVGDEPNSSFHLVILVKIEDLGCLSPLSL